VLQNVQQQTATAESSQHFVDHVPLDIGQSVIETVVVVRQLFMLESQEVQDRRVEVRIVVASRRPRGRAATAPTRPPTASRSGFCNRWPADRNGMDRRRSWMARPSNPTARLGSGSGIRYFRNRADEGTDIEVAHPSSYGHCTVGVYCDLHDLADNAAVRDLAGKLTVTDGVPGIMIVEMPAVNLEIEATVEPVQQSAKATSGVSIS
jgi:hypothetical protein